MTFIDIHCHIDRYKEDEIKAIIKRARDAGVGIILNNGNSIETNKKNIELAKKYSEIKIAMGIHPTELKDLSENEIEKEIEFIKKNKDKIIGIGEVGMDLKESEVEAERQIEIFKKFVKLSIEINKPIIVHSRKAELKCIEILEQMNAKKVLMHCFSGKMSLLDRIQKNKWFISIPSSIKYNSQFQLIAEKMPIEQIFCETDAPFLHPDREMNNEPALVLEAYKKIAEIKKLKISEVEEDIFNNYQSLFK